MVEHRWHVPLSTPDIGAEERAAVADALASGWVAPAGPQLDAFEERVAAASGRRYAVAVNSGTAALHLGLLAAGVRGGDTVLCPTLTFVATVNAVRYVGAEPLLVDSDESGNVDPRLLREALDGCRARGERVGAIVPVDLYGKLADYARICAIADEASVPVVADAAESLGATREGARAGSFGLAAALSFNGNKIVTTSGGGALVTDDEQVAATARSLAGHARVPAAHYQHERVGYAYRLSNVLAALGTSQLRRLPEFLAQRRAHREAYRVAVERLPGARILGGADAGDNCWLTAIELDPAEAPVTPALLAARLQAAGVETRPVFKPMHLQPAHRCCRSALSGVAERMFARGLVLPSGSRMTPGQRDAVIAALTDAWGGEAR